MNNQFGNAIYKDSYVLYNKDRELSRKNVGLWKVDEINYGFRIIILE